MFSLSVYETNHKVLDKWTEITRTKLISRLREDERIFNMGKSKRSYTIGKITTFEYANGERAEIRVD